MAKKRRIPAAFRVWVTAARKCAGVGKVGSGKRMMCMRAAVRKMRGGR